MFENCDFGMVTYCWFLDFALPTPKWPRMQPDPNSKDELIGKYHLKL